MSSSFARESGDEIDAVGVDLNELLGSQVEFGRALLDDAKLIAGIEDGGCKRNGVEAVIAVLAEGQRTGVMVL